MESRNCRIYWRKQTANFAWTVLVLLTFIFTVPECPCASLSHAMEYGATPALEESAQHSAERPQWLVLESGLEFAEFVPEEGQPKISVLRIDPEYYDFILKSAGEENQQPKTLSQWTREYGLTAAINASMYLPDNRTSTGYMRNGAYINNPRIVERFGAFFVARPKEPGLPWATILDRDQSDWRTSLDKYDLAIQNYRMTNAQRRILWSPGGPLYSISAVAIDGAGKILFLHSRMPIEAYSFIQHLLHLPLDVRQIMYVEGGSQAGLVIDAPQLKRDLEAPHARSLFATGNLRATLPNILGIRPRAASRPDGAAPDQDSASQAK